MLYRNFISGERRREREREREYRKACVSRRSCFILQVVVAVASFRACSRHCFQVSWNGSACRVRASTKRLRPSHLTIQRPWGGLCISQYTGCHRKVMWNTSVVWLFQKIIWYYIQNSKFTKNLIVSLSYDISQILFRTFNIQSNSY